MASTDISNMKHSHISETMFVSIWHGKGDEEEHAKFLASLHEQKVSSYQVDGKPRCDHDIQCGQCIGLGQVVECRGFSPLGCLPCAEADIDGCTQVTTFRIWNTMRVFNLSILEVGYLMEKYIAKGEASSIEGEQDAGELSGSFQGSGGQGNGEVLIYIYSTISTIFGHAY